MHATFVKAFSDAPGFSGARMGPTLARVDPPSRRLRLRREDGRVEAVEDWVVERVDLIGVSIPELPLVYPHSTQWRRSGRPLTAFEGQALDLLRAGHSVVSRWDADGLHVVGAIRAEKACLQCHTAKQERDLLGAFHYLLQTSNDSWLLLEGLHEELREGSRGGSLFVPR